MQNPWTDPCKCQDPLQECQGHKHPHHRIRENTHMGSQLQLHKDIRTPGTCNQCQKYGHIAPDCKETSPTCAKCGEDHRTRECASGGTKCTPCGSPDHQTNDERCPERIGRENTSMDKKPEAFTPYFISDERWTWGLNENESPTRTL